MSNAARPENDVAAPAAGRKIVLTTIGSLGDLHPFVAIALALKARGFRPVLAVAADQLDACRVAGVEAVAVLPAFAEVAQRMGLSERAAAGRIISNQRHMLEQVILPALSSCAARLDALVIGAEAIVSSVFVLAAPIVAEKHRLPLISVVLQPMAMLSIYDPPHTPDFWMLRWPPVGRAGARWNRLIYAAMRLALDRLYGKRLDVVRAERGLHPTGGRHMLEAGKAAPLTLCCYSSAFGPLQPDAPRSAQVIGFPVFDGRIGAEAALAPALQAFVDRGAPPIIFTLGSFAVQAAGRFYEEAAAAARQIGVRAVLLTGSGNPVESGDGIYTCAYAPHSLLFRRALMVVHHGGVGTTGQALLAGIPQLVVPHMGDQFDNAHRIERLGIGRVLSASRFSAARAAETIAALRDDPKVATEASRIAREMAVDDPGDTAARAIDDHLATRIAADPFTDAARCETC